MDGKVNLFLYGVMQSDEVLEAVIGARPTRTPAVLSDFGLYIQRIDQVPDTPPSGLPVNLAPRTILKRNWGDRFETYMVRPKQGGRVAGSIIEATQLQKDLLDDWELCELGWYREWEGVATTIDRQTIHIVTEGGRLEQGVDREVDGLSYPALLEGQSALAFQRVAQEARREFFERRGLREATLTLALAARK
jgi:hypothetical protein